MKILFYTHSFAPHIGGVERYLMLLAEGLARYGGGAENRVTVVTQTSADGFDDWGLPFTVIRRPALRSLWRLLGEAEILQLAGPAFLPLLIGLLRRKRIVVEHHGYQAVCPNGLLFFEPTKRGCPGHFMARRFRECLRCNATTLGWRKSALKLLLAFARRRMCQRVAANVGVTNHVTQRLSLTRPATIYHGVPERPVALAPPADAPAVFAYVGRLVSEKGLPVLLEAVQMIRDEGPAFRLKIIGDGPERQYLESMTDNLGLRAHVVFRGFLRGDCLEAALQDVIAVVMPSIWEETAGLVAIEQMMQGRLVIASNLGGLSEIVDGAGLQFPPGDAAALAACLGRVLQEPQLRIQMSQKARDRATQQFQQGRMVGEHLAMYRGLVRNPSRA